MSWTFFLAFSTIAATNNVAAFSEPVTIAAFSELFPVSAFSGQITDLSLIDLLIKFVDKNNDGKITEEEVKDKIPIPDVPVEVIIRKLDKDNDKAVDRKDLEIAAKKFVGIYLGMADFDSDGYVTEKEANTSMSASPIKGLVQSFTFWFDLADLNGDGTISDADYPKLAPFKKLKTFLLDEKYQLPEPVSLLYKTIDANEDYQLSKTEVIHFFTTVLKKIDKNNDGTVTIPEVLQTMEEFKFPQKLINMLKQQYTKATFAKYRVTVLKAVFNEVDNNKDGKINSDELSTLLTKPISESFMMSVNDALTNQVTTEYRATRPMNMNGREREAALSAVSSFLKDPKFVCCSACNLNSSILGLSLALIIYVLGN